MHSGEKVPENLRDPKRSFDQSQRDMLLRNAGGCCENCQERLTDDWHAHHAVPHSAGGATKTSNGQALCSPCHSRAHRRLNRRGLRREFSDAQIAERRYVPARNWKSHATPWVAPAATGSPANPVDHQAATGCVVLVVLIPFMCMAALILRWVTTAIGHAADAVSRFFADLTVYHFGAVAVCLALVAGAVWTGTNIQRIAKNEHLQVIVPVAWLFVAMVVVFLMMSQF